MILSKNLKISYMMQPDHPYLMVISKNRKQKTYRFKKMFRIKTPMKVCDFECQVIRALGEEPGYHNGHIYSNENRCSIFEVTYEQEDIEY